MLSAFGSSTGLLLLSVLSATALAFTAVIYRKLRSENQRMKEAIDNMSQGLSMFDAQTRITLINRRYLEMYRLDPTIVKPGCTLKELIQHRKNTGLFSGDVDSYVAKIIDDMRAGGGTAHYEIGRAHV